MYSQNNNPAQNLNAEYIGKIIKNKKKIKLKISLLIL